MCIYSKESKVIGINFNKHRNEKLDRRSHKSFQMFTFHLYTSALAYNLRDFGEDMTF